MSVRQRDDGFSLPEVLVACLVAATVLSFSLPVTTSVVDAGRGRQAAGFVAARLRLARHQAVSRSANVGLVFDQLGSTWTFRVCVDANGNGLRRAEIASGSDGCVEGPHDIATLFPGVAVAVDGAIPGPEGDAASADPVRFGRSNIASFASSGSCTAGSLYLRSPGEIQYAIRVSGTTGRTRILRYNRATQKWDEL